MKQTKKNGFLTFMFSLLPGAAEMYMGFMKMGLSILSVFAAMIILLCAVLRQDYMMVLPFIVWVYAFFHARNIAKADDATFDAIEDRYFWEELTNGKSLGISKEKSRKIIAWTCIGCGCLGIWEILLEVVQLVLPGGMLEYIYPVLDNVPAGVFAILIIYLGCRLIRGKKAEINEEISETNK